MGDRGAPVRIAALGSRPCLRLQAWVPEIARGVTSVASAPVCILSFAPGDWLIQAREGTGSELQRLVESYLPADGYALVDLSDGLAVFEIQGSAARELLSKGCGLDLHPKSFAPGQCARTRFAGIPVIVESLDGPVRFELTVARTYGRYLASWLEDAAVEFGSTTAEPTGRPTARPAANNASQFVQNPDLSSAV